MKSLKTRLITIFTAVIFVLTVVLGFIVVNRVGKNLTDDYYDDLQNLVVEKANYIRSKIDSEIFYIEAIAQDDKIINKDISWEKKADYFEKEAKRAGYMYYSYADKNGNATLFNKKRDTVNVKDRDYYKKAMSGKGAISDVIISAVTKKPTIIVASPIIKNGQIQGVFYGAKEATFLSDIVSKIKYGKTGFGIIINDKGTTVGHANKKLVLSQSNTVEIAKKDSSFKSLADLIENIISEKKVGKGEYEYKGTKNAAGFSPIEGTNWTMVFGGEISEVLTDVHSIRNIIIILSLMTIVIGALVTYFISGTIASPIIAVTKRMNELSNLDFTIYGNEDAIKYLNREDEIGSMARALRKMRDNIAEFITKTDESAQQIVATSEELTATSQQSATASEEVAKTIEDIAKGAGNQAQDTENSASSVEEMGSLLEQNKEYVEELNNAAKDIGERKEEGFSILKELIEKTKENNEAATNIYEIILSNNESAEKIDSASSMIQSIADQTNLLALNAAIEAARAGEHGKGFAVVADEIRKLAEQSNSFTEEIKKVIGELKIKSQNAVDKMEKVKEINQYQSESVKGTEEKFEKIAYSIDVTNNVIEKLNRSEENMSKNKEKLMNLMQNLSAIAEENAAGTEEASASIEQQAASIEEIANSSEGLARIAEELDSLIKKFKV
ncbi:MULTISPECIES: methyl-accepting chemotaxis protein [Clostridium]|jgi:methyl-accepting chemotaxis protein|uniref:histidine kinase n=2 Tax=Clostridium TaxID=1485 RepID=A0A0D1BV90_CLOBO|nr:MULTISPECIES: methyl-accepting chemotaxis protein [Clostridium]MBE6077154.1 methyl-accepting chemotaxis protein [Clostridium lundense]MDU2832199.1 methyl-accepting chemotaxis protein [Clostridium botulinum]KIS22706.1 chemotaxis protein [Clostridium botulinum B2 450]MCW7998545.1 methyl-accepting chemotaxis protein [Clostridium sp. cpc1]MDU4545652.1 methyl-accepting chemotaxis protein [Clostridium botulinum]